MTPKEAEGLDALLESWDAHVEGCKESNSPYTQFHGSVTAQCAKELRAALRAVPDSQTGAADVVREHEPESMASPTSAYPPDSDSASPLPVRDPNEMDTRITYTEVCERGLSGEAIAILRDHGAVRDEVATGPTDADVTRFVDHIAPFFHKRADRDEWTSRAAAEMVGFMRALPSPPGATK